MKEFVEKLIERLGNQLEEVIGWNHHEVNAYGNAIRIVKQLAEEYNPSKSSSLAEQIADDLSKVLKEAKDMGCKEVRAFHHIPLENVEIAINALKAYNGKYDSELIEKINFAIEASNTNDNYMTGLKNGMRYCLALIDGKEPEFEQCNQDSTKNNQGWILCSERMPKPGKRYLVTAVWKEKDFEKQSVYIFVYGSNGVWHSYNYEPVSRCEIIAWQPLPEPYEREE